MRILPVIDLKGGVVVRGVAGRRDEYRPIVSKLCDGPSPRSVARGLREAFGFKECYVADLDAIATGQADLDPYLEIDREGFRQWVDAGAAIVPPPWSLPVNRIATPWRPWRTIVGLESLSDQPQCFNSTAEDTSLVFSLDLMHGRPLTKIRAYAELSPETIAARFIEGGATCVIVLDLAGVGVGEGVPTLDLCRRLRFQHPKLELISGGGVRGIDDLKSLRDAGCDAALVASALHDGRITREMLDTI